MTECFAQQLQWILGLRIVWIVFLFVFGPWTCWEGMRMWLNQIIIGWNQLQYGGMVLFAGDTTNQRQIGSMHYLQRFFCRDYLVRTCLNTAVRSEAV